MNLLITSRERYEDSLTRTSVGGGVRGLLEDTADVVFTDLDVTLLSPGWAPRVLDEEVVITVLGTVADGEDTVVESGSALLGSDDTGLVTLEGHLVSLDGDRDGLLHKDSLHSRDRLGGDILETGDLNSATSSLGFVTLSGLTLSRGVGISSLSDHGVLLSIGESVVHETPIAAVVLSGALNKLFLREGNELASSDEVSTF